jgi:predicted permease
LSWRLPPGERDEVIGDLDEEFQERAHMRGQAWAQRWYWRQTLTLAWSLGTPPALADQPRRSHVMALDDARFAVRRLVKQPGATVASIVTLAGAIGAAVAAASLLSAVLLHPLPITDPDTLVVVGARRMSTPKPGRAPAPLQNEHIFPVYSAVRASGIFAQVAAGGSASGLVTGGGASSYRPIYFATHDFFQTIGVHLQAGRDFAPEDDKPGAAPVAVLSDRFWRRAFNANLDVLGQSILVKGKTVVMVGIAPAGFRGLSLADAPDLYMPLHVVADILPGTNWFAVPDVRMSATAWVRVIGRLKPGMNATNTSAQLVTLPPGPGVSGLAFGLTDVNTAALAEGVRPDMSRFARLLAVTVSLLLVIGCLTAGMLLLLRTEARRDEFAMCMALGATRARLAMGVVLEGALLSGVGVALALPLSWWLLAGVRAFQLPGGIDIDLLEIPLDGRLLGAGIVSAMIATLLIALVAGVFGFSANVAGALRARAGATPRVGHRRTRATLIVAQVAVALVLLVGAGLFTRSLIAALSLNPGYETRSIATTRISPAPQGYRPDRAIAFFDDLRERLSHSPAIRSAALFHEPGGMSGGGKMMMDGEDRQVPSFVLFSEIDERYFSTMGLSIVRGRDFTARDGAGAPLVAIVSQSLGRFLAHGGDPLGHTVSEFSHRQGQPADTIRVVGVVPDIITSVTALEPLVLYRPLAQMPDKPVQMEVVLHAAGDPSVAVLEAVTTIRNLEPAMIVPAFTTIDQRLEKQMSPQRFAATVLGALGAIAALLTLFGIYVLAESMSALRRREMGVRAALGATGPQLSALVLRETTRLIVLGLATGLFLVWLGTSLIRTFLFGVQPLDPTTLIVVASAMLTLALAVSLRPALRAARVDLARILRDE